MPKKKKKNIFLIIIIILFSIYLALYYAFLGGYYEYKANTSSSLTEEKMKEFETLIKEGKQVNISEFIPKNKDYTNSVSKIGETLGKSTTDFLTKGLGSIFKVISKLVTN